MVRRLLQPAPGQKVFDRVHQQHRIRIRVVQTEQAKEGKIQEVNDQKAFRESKQDQVTCCWLL